MRGRGKKQKPPLRTASSPGKNRGGFTVGFSFCGVHSCSVLPEDTVTIAQTG